MKSFAKLHVWWPSIDTDIQQTVQSCSNCQETARDLVRVRTSSPMGHPKKSLAASAHWLRRSVQRYYVVFAD